MPCVGDGACQLKIGSLLQIATQYTFKCGSPDNTQYCKHNIPWQLELWLSFVFAHVHMLMRHVAAADNLAYTVVTMMS